MNLDRFLLQDPLVLQQAQAANSAADAAWETVHVYWWAFGLSLVSVLVNMTIVYVAVMSPARERHTRDIETRKARVRLNIKSAEAGKSCLVSLGSVQKYIEEHSIGNPPKRDVVERYVVRLNMRQRVIEHLLSMQLRDGNLVRYLAEIQGMAQHCHSKMEDKSWDIEGYGIVYGMDKTLKALKFKEERRSELDDRLEKIEKIMKDRDGSLQNDLNRIWSWRWFLPFNRNSYLRTDRDD